MKKQWIYRPRNYAHWKPITFIAIVQMEVLFNGGAYAAHERESLLKQLKYVVLIDSFPTIELLKAISTNIANLELKSEGNTS